MPPRLIDSQNVSKIPESLRRKLSEGGKKAAAKLTFEDRSKGGKRGWLSRIAKAKAAEQQAAVTTNEPEPDQTTKERGDNPSS